MALLNLLRLRILTLLLSGLSINEDVSWCCDTVKGYIIYRNNLKQKPNLD
jgi:hypothetical protein